MALRMMCSFRYDVGNDGCEPFVIGLAMGLLAVG